MNDENLKHFTSENAAKNGAKGGRASGRSKRKRKTIREALEAFLACSAPDKAAEQIAAVTGLRPTDITFRDLLVFAQINKANKGNTEAAKFVRDTVGESPTQKIDHTTGGEKIERKWEVVFPENFDFNRIK